MLGRSTRRNDARTTGRTRGTPITLPTGLPASCGRRGPRRAAPGRDPGRVREAGLAPRGNRPGSPGPAEPPHEAPDVSGADPPRHADRVGGTLQVYNWDDYMYKRVLRAFEDEY